MGSMGSDNYLVGVDMGSGGCKITIVNASGKVITEAFNEYPTYHPQPGWSEQNPEEWLSTFKLTIREAMERGNVNADRVVSLAFSGTTHSFILLDHDDYPLRPPILWTDNRSLKQVEWLNDHYGESIFKITLHAPTPHWTLPQLLWLKENESEILGKAKKLLMPKDYIRYKLTGIWATDWVDAHGTLLFDVPQRRWSKALCDLAGISMEILPPVHPPEQIVGSVTRLAASETGLKAGIPVVTGTTDQAAEAFGNGAVYPGQGIIKLATAGNVAVVTGEPHPIPLRMVAYYHVIPGLWYTMCGLSYCAANYRWLRDVFCQQEVERGLQEKISPYVFMDRLAQESPLGAEGLFFIPTLNGTNEHPYAGGSFFGIRPNHRKEHFIRAVLEGVAFGLNVAVKRLEEVKVQLEDFRIIGGGSRSSLWRQIVSDVIGKTLIQTQVPDASFGTALLGGLGVGIFPSVREAAKLFAKAKAEVKPIQKNHERYCKLFEVYKKAESELVGAYRLLRNTRM